MEGHQIVALRIRVRFSSITPHGQVCIVAIAADCKSVTLIHRRFDSYLAHQYKSPFIYERRHTADSSDRSGQEALNL